MLGTTLIVVLVLALVGALPRWTHSKGWGYYPTGGVGLILVIVVILLLLGRIEYLQVLPSAQSQGEKWMNPSGKRFSSWRRKLRLT